MQCECLVRIERRGSSHGEQATGEKQRILSDDRLCRVWELLEKWSHKSSDALP